MLLHLCWDSTATVSHVCARSFLHARNPDSPWNPNRYLRRNAGSEYRHSHQSLSSSEIFVRRSPVLMTEPLSRHMVQYPEIRAFLDEGEDLNGPNREKESCSVSFLSLSGGETKPAAE